MSTASARIGMRVQPRVAQGREGGAALVVFDPVEG
jgi:hypothetical protein